MIIMKKGLVIILCFEVNRNKKVQENSFHFDCRDYRYNIFLAFWYFSCKIYINQNKC